MQGRDLATQARVRDGVRALEARIDQQALDDAPVVLAGVGTPDPGAGISTVATAELLRLWIEDVDLPAVETTAAPTR